MRILGLTGGIASGKSTVSRELDRLGAMIIDSDLLAHLQMEPETAVWHKVKQYFGDSILKEDQAIDRTALGNIVFNDPRELMALNELVHPAVMEETKKLLRIIEDHNPQQDVVVEIPLLFEMGLRDAFDQVWTVWIDEGEQVSRLMKRNNLSEEEAYLRLKSQMRLDDKADMSDYVIDNSRDLDYTFFQVRKRYQEFQKLPNIVQQGRFWQTCSRC